MPLTPFQDLTGSGGKGRVLLASGSRSTATYVGMLLRNLGFDICRADTSEQLAAGLVEYPIDIAIATIDSPLLEEILARCSGSEGGRAIPVLGLVPPGATLHGATLEVSLPIDGVTLQRSIAQCLATTAGPIDERRILALWGATDSADFVRVARVFVTESHDRIAQIDGCLAGGDLKGIEREAHSLKGAASYVGASTVELLSARLEKSAARGDLTQVTELARTLRDNIAPSEAALRKLIVLST